LNGQAVVPTIATDILRINEFHVVSVGTGGVAAGTIDIRHLDNSPIYSRIGAGNNNALTCVWTVPASKTAYIVSWGGGAGGGNKDVRFLLRATCMTNGTLTAGVFHEKDILLLEDGSDQVLLSMPIKVPAEGDIIVSVVSAAQTARCSAHFSGWYET